MFQRLVAIPQEEYMQLTSVQQARQPITQQFYNLERQYNEQDYIRDPYKRVMLQSETLDQMKDLKERMRQDITASTPKPYQQRARSLFQSLESFLNFNERGEIHNDSGRLIPQSRLEDLVQHAVRDRRRNLTPTGWSEFRHLLESHNVPKFMLNRDTLDEMRKDELSKREEPHTKREELHTKKEVITVKKEPNVKKSTRLRKPNQNYGIKHGFLQQY